MLFPYRIAPLQYCPLAGIDLCRITVLLHRLATVQRPCPITVPQPCPAATLQPQLIIASPYRITAPHDSSILAWYFRAAPKDLLAYFSRQDIQETNVLRCPAAETLHAPIPSETGHLRKNISLCPAAESFSQPFEVYF